VRTKFFQKERKKEGTMDTRREEGIGEGRRREAVVGVCMVMGMSMRMRMK